MKKESRHVRVSIKDYELLRRLAYKLHKPMGVIINELLKARKS